MDLQKVGVYLDACLGETCDHVPSTRRRERVGSQIQEQGELLLQIGRLRGHMGIAEGDLFRKLAQGPALEEDAIPDPETLFADSPENPLGGVARTIVPTRDKTSAH